MATITKVSPLAPASFPDLPAIDGVRFASVAAGVRYQGRTDVMLAVLDPGTSVAGVFTKSATRAAPVLDCQDKIGGPSDGPAAILVNSGNANAFTGHYGQTSVSEVTQAVSDATGVPVARVFTSSTGVIGEPLPHERIVAQLETLKSGLSRHAIEDAAKAIMTTDTFPKGASAQVEIDGKTVSIAGIAKGSGMIAPDMATMLVYIFTDAQVDQSALAGDAGRADGPDVQLHHRGQRYLDLGQPAAVCHRGFGRRCHHQRGICRSAGNGDAGPCPASGARR